VLKNLFKFGQNVVIAEQEEIFTAQHHLGATVLWQEDLVTGGDAHGHVDAFLVLEPGPTGDHGGLLDLAAGGLVAGDVDSGGSDRFRLEALHEHAVEGWEELLEAAAGFGHDW